MEASSKKPVRLRMAPSPTGYLHIGTARTTLFNWLYARHIGGVFVLRMEDTDKERSKPEYEIQLIEGLHWLGLEWDEGPDIDESGKLVSKGEYGPYRQSERTDIYKKYLEKLLSEGKAYYCYCTAEELEAQRQSMEADGVSPKYSGKCRSLTSPPSDRKSSVIRFKVAEEKVSFKDLIRGTVEFDAALMGDIVIAKDLDTPLYNFAVVVDDYEMRISHVVRGEDHIANTPKQILIQKALDFETPVYAHVPLILNSDRSKLSKRKNKASLLEYRDDGYLPEAMCNFMALLGWHPSADDREILSLEEISKEFTIERVQKAGAIFDKNKLDWINSQYIKKLSEVDLAEKLTPLLETKRGVVDKKILNKLIALERDRIKTLSEFVDATALFFELPDYGGKILTWRKSNPQEAREVLMEAIELMKGADEEFFEDKEALSNLIAPLLTKHEKGSVFWPIRVALSGSETSPDPLDIACVVGRRETVKRLEIALGKIGSAI